MATGAPEMMPQGAPADAQQPGLGAATSRIDGRLKVMGQARYGSDFDGGRQPAYGFFACSTIGKGRIESIDDAAARAVPGVIEIFTHRNVGDKVKPGKTFSSGGAMGSSIAPLSSPQIWYDGQPIALVIAETREAAREAGERIVFTYRHETPSASFDSPGVFTGSANPTPKPSSQEGEMPKVGDADRALALAPVKIDAHYSTPTQHHNPIELFGTTAAWNGGKLTVWESTQNVYGFQAGIAEQLGIEQADVRWISPFIGGGFGSRGPLRQTSAIVAHAARVIGRPIQAESTRQQGFDVGTYRAETRHRVRLAANHDGKLQALIHEGWEFTSRPDDYKVAGVDTSTRVYACPNVRSDVQMVHGDRNTPGFMRSPPEIPYLFALESAMDELAYALKMDPVELRRINDTQIEPIKGLPYTSRALMPCFDAAAKAFGWARRSPEPGSMRDGDWLIGYGCATTMYPTQMGPAAVRLTLGSDGMVKAQTAGHEIGTGIYTAVALIVVQDLGVPLDKVKVELGDSDLPPAPVAGGSNSTASICNVVAKACEQIRSRLAEAAVAAGNSPFHGADPKTLKLTGGMLADAHGRTEPLEAALGRIGGGAIEAYAENVPHGVPPTAAKGMYKGKATLAGGAKLKDRIQFAFGAQFVELRVHAETREIRCARLTGAYAAGRIVNPKTAKSQLMGGQIWGLSAALHEATEIDPREARYVNHDLAEYLIPVNADVPLVETIFLPEQDDQVNDLGIKGLGELGNVGLNAACANAIFHATGIRVRDLPIRPESLLTV